MTTNTSFLSTSELDFIALRESMKNFLSSQTNIRDYNYEGSNIAIILDLLAWNAHLNAHYLNMVGSEMFLDTAQLLDSMYSHSKELNYVPRSRSSSRADVNLAFSVGNATPTSITVPKYYTVTAIAVDDKGSQVTYSFMTDADHVIRPDALGAFVSSNVTVYEGSLVREAFLVNTTSRYVLQSANLDVSSVEVYVQVSNTNSTNTEFVRAPNLYGVGGNDAVFFLQGAYDGRYEILFGDGNIGRALDVGNVVKVFYRDCSADVPNGITKFTASASVQGFPVSAVQVRSATFGGAEKESLDSIRFNAPRWFTTQERAVTTSDFVTLVKAKFPQLQAVAAYGGEEVTPKQYGRVIISAKPYGDEVISDQLKGDIVAFLGTKNIVTQAAVVDADIFYLAVHSDVVYDRNLTRKTASQLQSQVLSTITGFANTNLDDFGIDFYMSKLIGQIDDVDPSIVGNDTRAWLVKKWLPKTGSTQSFVFSFGNQLRSETRSADPLHHDAIVYTSAFEYVKSGVVYSVVAQDDGGGNIFLYTQQDTGRVVIENSVGSVNYDTGSVSMSVNVYSYDSTIKVSAIPEKNDLKVRANLFLTLSPADVSVNVTESTP